MTELLPGDMPLITRRILLRRGICLAIGLPIGLQALVACTSTEPAPATSVSPQPTPTTAPAVVSPAQPSPTTASTSAPPAAVAPGQPSPVVATATIPPAAPTVVPATNTPTPLPPTPTAEPTMTPTPTPIAYDEKRITHLLGEASTSYAGSIAERAHNVELATSRLNQKLLAPDEIFSFNKMLGPTTLSSGFKIGYGITLNAGRPETVPSVGGGICQVATTLFQAVFWAGIPIVEHNRHFYWIAKYGQPPYGRIGLDATVDDPGPDFRFKNTTGDWIRVETWVKDQKLGFKIFGVETGWSVTVAEPLVRDILRKDPEPVIEEDPTMPAGRSIWVETAEDGFTVTNLREVFKDNELIDRYRSTYTYKPARNVQLVGTKGATPTPTPEPPATPTPVATPTPDTQPDQYRLGEGKVRMPNLIGMPEQAAKAFIESLGLANTHTNHQGRDQVPESILATVPVGAVLSQDPAPGQIVLEGTLVFVAVRKE